MKKYRFTIACVGIAFCVMLIWFVPRAWMSTATSQSPSIEIRVANGWSATQIAYVLEQKKVIDSALGYRLFAYIDKTARQGKAGIYTLHAGASYKDIARVLRIGPVRADAEFQIIEGWDISDIQKILQTHGVDIDLFKISASDWKSQYPFLADLPRGATLEGYLFPDTYQVYIDLLPDGLLKKQLDAFSLRAPRLIEEAKKQGKSLHQIVTMASIIEKESRPADRKVIAGIFWNRLRIGMPLQSDATVNYVTRGGRARPTFDDLAVASPYNTYTVKGLPPGPISSPSEDALEAALFPTKSDYLYFLHDENGKTYFASTFEEHQQNRVKAYGR